MALTQILSDGIANGAITTQQLAPGAAGGPKITQIQITDSGGTVLDDTAVGLSGGYIKITGTGFSAGAQVIVNNTPATSTTFTSTTVLNAQVGPAAAGTYVVYVVNTDGGVAIAVNGLTYSAEPLWVTDSTLNSGASDTPLSIQLNATDATTYALQAGSSLPAGLTLTSGGLLSGTISVVAETTYSFTVVATDAQAQDSPRTFSITITVNDPYFNLNALLLPGNGTNNGTNNTFLDSSNNNFTVTRYGNTTQGTYTPYSLTGWSNYFDGNGDSITYTGGSSLNFGTSDFTIELWVNMRNTGTFSSFLRPDDNGTFPEFGYDWGTTELKFQARDAAIMTVSTSAVVANSWNHIAVSRSGTSLRLFVNGTQVGTTTTNSTNFGSPTNAIRIGGSSFSASHSVNGYISNFRIVKGTALYTSNFIPPTSPLTAITNTSVLTCQNNRFIDNSTNNFAITINGDTTVQPFSPFAPGASYTTATIGGSSYFDGTGDYLSYPADSGFWNDTSFTIELWAYCTKASGSATILASWTDGNFGSGSWGVEMGTGGTFTASNGGSSTTNQGPWLTGTTTIRNTGWHHLVITKSGTQYRLFTDGKFEAYRNESFSTTNNIPIKVGYQGDGTYQPEGRVYQGYLSGIRILRNSIPAAYQTASTTTGAQVFTPPTSPPTNVSGTTVLLNFTNGQIIDYTSKNLIETLGDAKISTAQSKWNGSSIYLDGTGDSLFIRANQLYNLSNLNYTIECWFYKNSNKLSTLISQGGSSWRIQPLANGGMVLNLAGSDAITYSSAISTSAWHHIAVVKNGSTTTMYIDGISVGTTSSNASNNNTDNIYIGVNPENSAWAFDGYIDDLRITRGYARYTGNFTPPTSAFQTQ